MWTAPDGHCVRRLDWPAPAGDCPEARGSILFMPGRGDFYEKWTESFAHWQGKGWQVSAGCWRGQAGSGRLGDHPNSGHVDDFADWVDDLARFWSGWAEGRRGPLVLVGHSMGGHIALRAVIEGRLDPAPAALVLSAPMLDVLPEGVPLTARRAFAALMAKLKGETALAWKVSEKPGARAAMRQSLLTHDDARYADELWWREARPYLLTGPATWGWVRAAMDSIALLFRPGALERVRVPVLLLAAAADRLVSPAAIRRAAERLADAETVFFGPEARHEVLREADPVRLRALAAIDDFLARRVARR